MKLKQPEIKGFTSDKKKSEPSKPTPMMQQYLEVKGRHQDYLLFYRMGDFYELFFKDAEIAATELGIALTKRGKLNDVDIPMCGVPAHSSQTYLSRLIALGYKVAVAEQLETQQTEKSTKYHKIFRRDVVKIITPGTILDDSLLNSKSYNHLLCISSVQGEISVSWTDMSIGKIKLQKISNNSINDLFELISRIEPEEIIISKSLDKILKLDSRISQFCNKFSNIPEDFFNLNENKVKIDRYFGNLFLEDKETLTGSDKSAVAGLINYLELTQKNNVPLIKEFELVNKEEFMQIDSFSVRSLEIFKTINGEKKDTLLETIDKTKTAAGGRLLKDFLKSPLINKKKITERHLLIQEFLNHPSVMTSILNCLNGHPDAERAISRITAKTNNPRDLLLIASFLNNAEVIFSEIKKLSKEVIEQLLPVNNVFKRAEKLKNHIIKNIVESPPISLNEGGIIKSQVSKQLDYLRNIKNEKQKEILNMQLKYSKACGINNLKIKYNNIHGYFIEVTNKNSNKVINSKDIKFYLIQNTVNNSRFQTDELKKTSNEILSSQEEAILLEKKIYTEICNFFEDDIPCINVISKNISFIDVITNFANLAKLRNYIRPELANKSIIQIKNCRHPVVEESLTNDSLEFIPNDCFMDETSFTWLITGPNMAGKSTFLRQIAIIIILNQIGSYVPAKSAKIGIFDKIFTRIGASDNLSRGMSTFMTEMAETSKIINEATQNSLVILDELGRGTSTEDGLAIAQAVLEYILNEIKCSTLFATHYKQLCKLSANYNFLKLKTLKIKKWNEEIIFLHKLIDGVSEGSFGIHVANMAGIKQPILERSKKILDSLGNEKINQITNLEKNEFKEKSKEDDKRISKLKNLIDEMDLNNLSPKEALDFLYSLKKNY
ncbi:MAG: DNA mismatch repair protein MutS [Rickettsiales bacterium]|nr:DNA mismatch repair protein MutS [Rickettsiales bacterium]|tara:strand:+ start:970 stop:3645 length:2676 start_codon:yes stop_codon:yes gene_type:complete